jgi:hypothetical protein
MAIVIRPIYHVDSNRGLVSVTIDGGEPLLLSREAAAELAGAILAGIADAAGWELEVRSGRVSGFPRQELTPE